MKLKLTHLLFLLFLVKNNLIFCMQENSVVSSSYYKAGSFWGDNYELLHLSRAILALPEILLTDSDNPEVIKQCAILSLLLTNGTICKLLAQKNGDRALLTEMLITGPKMSGYLLSALYDFLRIHDAPHLALKNKSKERITAFKHFKAQQLLKLAFEFLVRCVAYQVSQETESLTSRAHGRSLTDIADYLELWRLLSRYAIYFEISGYTLSATVTLNHEKSDMTASLPLPSEKEL